MGAPKFKIFIDSPSRAVCRHSHFSSPTGMFRRELQPARAQNGFVQTKHMRKLTKLHFSTDDLQGHVGKYGRMN
jgi:hypothetical protein